MVLGNSLYFEQKKKRVSWNSESQGTENPATCCPPSHLLEESALEIVVFAPAEPLGSLTAGQAELLMPSALLSLLILSLSSKKKFEQWQSLKCFTLTVPMHSHTLKLICNVKQKYQQLNAVVWKVKTNKTSFTVIFVSWKELMCLFSFLSATF